MPRHDAPSLASCLHDGADHGVQAGTVTAAGEQADLHGIHPVIMKMRRMSRTNRGGACAALAPRTSALRTTYALERTTVRPAGQRHRPAVRPAASQRLVLSGVADAGAVTQAGGRPDL